MSLQPWISYLTGKLFTDLNDLARTIAEALTQGSPFDASNVTYTPGTANNWPTPAPTTVAQGLDDLATPNNSLVSNGATLGPALTVTWTSGNQIQQKTGVFQVTGMISGIAAAAAVVNVTIQLDGVAASIPLVVATSGASNNWAASICIPIHVPAGHATHTFGISATSGSNLTVAAGGAELFWAET